MVRPLKASDIEAAANLCQTAGWNQTRQDWSNLLRLAPQGCFCIEVDSELAATTTAVCYGSELAWIGMVLTHPRYRGRGFARALMEHALEYLEQRDVGWIKLDATDMGRPLYRKLGFEDEGIIERWLRSSGEVPNSVPRSAASIWSWLDLPAFGADRSELLNQLGQIGSAEIPDQAYAMGRPGAQAAYFGPCVSLSAGAAADLVEWFLARHGGEQVYWDLLPANSEAVHLARNFGFEPVRRLVRMARRETRPFMHDDSRVFAIAGFEYG